MRSITVPIVPKYENGLILSPPPPSPLPTPVDPLVSLAINYFQKHTKSLQIAHLKYYSISTTNNNNNNNRNNPTSLDSLIEYEIDEEYRHKIKESEQMKENKQNETNPKTKLSDLFQSPDSNNENNNNNNTNTNTNTNTSTASSGDNNNNPNPTNNTSSDAMNDACQLVDLSLLSISHETAKLACDKEYEYTLQQEENIFYKYHPEFVEPQKAEFSICKRLPVAPWKEEM